MKFDGLILDVDGTIWNTTSIVADAWNEAIEENFPEVKRVTAGILENQFGKTMDVIAKNLFPELDDGQKKILIDKCAEHEQKALLENKKDVTYKNVRDTIKKLSEKIPLFIVSNCQSGYIELVIEKNKIKDFITDFECFGDTGMEKDQNISLLVKRNSLKSPVYVGDTQGDYDACKKAEVPFVWASYGFGKTEDENYFAKIDDFSELEKILF